MSSYWEKRAVDSIGRMEKAVNGQIPDLVKAFEQARKDLNDKVFYFYARYAKNNKITLDEAQKALSLSELREFRGDLAEFERLAKDSIGTFNLQVDNLSVKARVTRYEALLTQCDAVLQKLYQEQKKQIEGTAAGVYTEEYYRRLFEIEQYTGFRFRYAAPGSDAVRKVLAQPVQGADISTRLWRQSVDTGFRIRQTLTNMFVTGRPPQDFATDLQKAIGAVHMNPDGTPGGTGKKYEAYRLLYNESTHALNQAHLQAYRDDGLKEYEIVATLDKATCEICAPMDGKHFPVSKAVEGVNHPSFHVSCRCTTAPYIPEAAGITGTRASRDPVTGKSVPTTAKTYDEWKAQQDAKYGAGTVARERKKAQNEASDFKQYQSYRAVLKENSPKSFAEFQNLKYNKPEIYRFAGLDYSRQKKLAGDSSLKLPNAEKATAAEEKFTKYLFNSESKSGSAKGSAFSSRLGYNADNWKDLQNEILSRAPRYPVRKVLKDQYGIKHEQKIVLYGSKGTPANVVVGWRSKDGRTWMTSCYIKDVE